MVDLKKRYRQISKLSKMSLKTIQEFGFIHFIRVAIYELKRQKLAVFDVELDDYHFPIISETDAYQQWLQSHDVNEKIDSINSELKTLQIKPKFSILVSVDSNGIKYLNQTLLSIKNQIYENWEVHVQSPTSLFTEVQKLMAGLKDHRFIIDSRTDRLINSISNHNSEYTVFVYSGSILTMDCFFRIVQALNEKPNSDIIYSDEDVISSLNQRKKPFFKPDWSSELFFSMDYLSNFFAVKNNLLQVQDILNDSYGRKKFYDLLLKLSEKTKNIHHIHHVLVSVKPIIIKNVDEYRKTIYKILNQALIRQNIKAKLIELPHKISGGSETIFLNPFRIKYLIDKQPKVSIIIPTHDNLSFLKKCLDSIKNKTNYKNYEIIIIDNKSEKKETLSYFNSLPYTIVKFAYPFNFAKMNNMGVLRASGEYLLFLNDDTVVKEPNWLTEMVSICEQKGIGIVGPKLLFGNKTIQHAGMVITKTGGGFHPFMRIPNDDGGYFGFANTCRNYSAVTGACLLIKKKIFEEVGGFDEKFDIYFNDTDLCIKVVNKGYRIVYTPYTFLIHDGASTIKEFAPAFFTVENHFRFIKKWPYLKKGDPFYNSNLGWDFNILLISK